MKKDIEILIKTILKIKRVSQSELSKITGIPLSTIKSYANSKFNATIENIKKLEKSLELDLGFLLLDNEVFNLNTVKGINNIINEYLYQYSKSENDLIKNTENILFDILRDLEMQNFIEEQKNKTSNNDKLYKNISIISDSWDFSFKSEAIVEFLKMLEFEFLEIPDLDKFLKDFDNSKDNTELFKSIKYKLKYGNEIFIINYLTFIKIQQLLYSNSINIILNLLNILKD